MRHSPIFTAIGAGLALLSLAVALAFWLTRDERAGQVLPAFALHTLDGSPVSLDRYKGKPAVINLWASWCAPCRREMPVLQAGQAAHPDIHFVFANQGEAAKVVQDYLAQEGLALHHVVLDADGAIARETGTRGLPTTIFLDAQGRVRSVHLGELSRKGLDDRLARLRRR